MVVVPESQECCGQMYPPPECFVKDIYDECTRLAQRLEKLQPRSRRIKYLALPKYITPKFRPVCRCDTNRKTDIIEEPPCMTRTEQLAYPYVRRILVVQKEFACTLEPARLCVLNRTLRKSMLSLYSRLANIQVPGERKCVCGWTKKDWGVHRRYLRKLARPKKVFKPPKPIHVWKDISLMKRYKKLCKPKKRREQVMPKWELTPELKKYKATARILLLAKPKERDENIHFQPLPIRVSPDAMRYKVSERIKQLATAPEVRLGESDLKENPFGIAPNALKAKCSDRVKELAEPKEFEDIHTRKDPQAISPAALKAKASPRILELAKPKGS